MYQARLVVVGSADVMHSVVYLGHKSNYAASAM